MEQQINALFELLASPDIEASVEQRREAAFTAHVLMHSWEHVNPATAADISAALTRLSSTDCPYRGALIESMLYRITGKETHLKQLSDHLRRYQPDISAGMATFNAVAAFHFNASSGEHERLKQHLGRQVQKQLFETLLARAETLFDLVKEQIPVQQATCNNRVVILTKQFIKPPHAPSADALSFAARLIKHHGKQVIILSTSELANVYDGAVAPCTQFNVQPELLGTNTLSFDGVDIPFSMLSTGEFTEQTMAKGLATIASYDPETIISVGAPSLLAEPFASTRFCFIYQTGRGIPLTRHCYFHTWDAPDQEMNELVQAEELTDQYLFVQHPGFDLKPPSTALTREQFGIDADAFVFVIVGMRLHSDVTPGFLGMLEHVLENERVHFAFAGHFERYDEILAKHPDLAKHSTHLGFQNDIMAVYNLSDAFINPTRKGGGGGIVYAMQAGLPVLTLPYGDAGMAASQFPQLSSYEEMASKAIELIETPETMQQYQKLAEREGIRFSNRDSFTDRIVEAFEKHCAG
ncbi:MAG: glycosyltransferase [Kordiimonas sp.]